MSSVEVAAVAGVSRTVPAEESDSDPFSLSMRRFFRRTSWNSGPPPWSGSESDSSITQRGSGAEAVAQLCGVTNKGGEGGELPAMAMAEQEELTLVGGGASTGVSVGWREGGRGWGY